MRNWEDYERIVKGMAFKFAISLKEPVDDLTQEGYICFLELVKTEDEEGLDSEFEAALSTMIYQIFVNMYKSKQTQKRSAQLVDFTKMDNILGFNPVHFLDIYCGLIQRHRGFVNLFIDTPQELIDLLKRESFYRAISIYAKTYLGWKEGRIRKLLLDFDSFLVE
jgi:hypothetical protein